MAKAKRIEGSNVEDSYDANVIGELMKPFLNDDDSLYEQRTPENLVYGVPYSSFFRTHLKPSLGWNLAIYESGKFKKTMQEGEYNVGFFKKLREPKIFSVYAGDINHSLKFFLKSRLNNLGDQAVLALTYRIVNPEVSLREDFFREGYLRPFVVEEVHDVIDNYSSLGDSLNLSLFNEKNYQDVKKILFEKFTNRFEKLGLTLQRLGLHIQNPFMVTGKLLDYKKQFSKMQIDSFYDIKKLSKQYEQEEEAGETGHRLKLSESVDNAALESERRHDVSRLEKMKGMKELVSGLEKQLMEGSDPISKGIAYGYIKYLLDMGVDFSSNGSKRKGIKSIDASVSDLLNYGMRISENPIELKKIKAIADGIKGNKIDLRIGGTTIDEVLDSFDVGRKSKSGES